jgi:hypothetical protein
MLQRATPPALTGRIFGLLDSLAVAGTVLGAVLAPIVVSSFGVRAGLVVAGGLLVVLTLACFPRLRVLDRVTDARRRELAPRVELLAGLDIFRSMSPQSLEALAASASEERITSGTTLIQEGDEADDFFVITSGTMEVLAAGEAGTTVVKVRDLGAGDYAGEIGLIEKMPRTATVRATEDCVVLRIKGDDFLEFVNQSPARSGALFAGIAGRLARTHPSYQPARSE